MVSPTADEAAVAKAEAAMDPIAESLAPAYERATRGRGHIEVVTKSVEPTPGAGDEPAEGETPDGETNAAPSTTTTTDTGCTVTSHPASAGTLALVGVVAAALVRRRRAPAR